MFAIAFAVAKGDERRRGFVKCEINAQIELSTMTATTGKRIIDAPLRARFDL
jgi:hypothetical protein